MFRRTTHWSSALLLFSVVILVVGCQDGNVASNPGETPAITLHGDLSLTTQITFVTSGGNWTLTSHGRSYDAAGDSTTFSYTLTGPNVNMHYVIGYPITDCSFAPSSWDPDNGTQNWSDFPIQPNVAWHPPVGSGGTNTFDFSYSFAGDIPAADVATGVKVNGVDYYQGYFIEGPGIPMYLISGNAFQDADASGSFDANETSISGVTVNLLQGTTILASTVTDANGYYEFETPCGTYTVKIDTSTLTGTQSKYFVSTTGLSYDVTVGPDSPGNDFGFDVNTTKVLGDLGNGNLPTDGLNANFWKKEYQFASTGKNGYFPKDTLVAFLDRVETLALDHPFIFVGTTDQRLAAAYDLLRKPTRTDLEVLERELFTVELNYAAGRGVDLSTELVLIGWGETLYIENGGTLNPKLGNTMAGTLLDATEIYQGINIEKSPGGGGTR